MTVLHGVTLFAKTKNKTCLRIVSLELIGLQAASAMFDPAIRDSYIKSPHMLSGIFCYQIMIMYICGSLILLLTANYFLKMTVIVVNQLIMIAASFAWSLKPD